MSVIQVNFNPAIWNAPGLAGNGLGHNGQDAFGIWFDHDGTTCWAFEYFGAGFGRFNLSDGSIVHQGAMFGTPGSSIFPAEREDGTALFAQDSSHYYLIMSQSSGGGHNHTLFKFHIAPGPAGNLLDGYCVVDATLDVATLTPAVNADELEDMITYQYGGVNYLAFCSASTLDHIWVVNTDTMAFVGSFGGSGHPYWKVFVDSADNLWTVSTTGSTANLIMWTPPLGVTGSTLNAVVHVISPSVLGTNNGVEFATYVPANNSVLLGNTIANTGELIGISLTTFTRTAFHADDLRLFYNGTFDAPQSSFDLGVTSGVLGFSGANGVPVTTSTQDGGYFNIIDPVSLTQSFSANVTCMINSSGVTTTIPTQHINGFTLFATPPHANALYVPSRNMAVVTYEFVGSPVYLVTFPTIFAQAVPPVIVAGQSSTVSWVATNASTLTSNEFGSIPLSGSQVVMPTTTNFYHFSADCGSATAVVEVEVLSNESRFNLEKLVLTMKQDPIAPVRGRGGK
jgi:hypothetical protein